MTGGAGREEQIMSRHLNLTVSGERIHTVELTQTVSPTSTRVISGLSGSYEVSFGDEHEVRVDDRVIGTIHHGVREVEANSALFEAETWSVSLPDQMYPSVSNILSEEEAVRMLISLRGTL